MNSKMTLSTEDASALVSRNEQISKLKLDILRIEGRQKQAEGDVKKAEGEVKKAEATCSDLEGQHKLLEADLITLQLEQNNAVSAINKQYGISLSDYILDPQTYELTPVNKVPPGQQASA